MIEEVVNECAKTMNTIRLIGAATEIVAECNSHSFDNDGCVTCPFRISKRNSNGCIFGDDWGVGVPSEWDIPSIIEE